MPMPAMNVRSLSAVRAVSILPLYSCDKHALSFSGGGLLAAAYHLGAFRALSQPNARDSTSLLDPIRSPMVGVSAGALVASVMSANAHWDDCVASLDRIINQVRSASGPLGCDILKLVKPHLQVLLPMDAHERLQARGTTIFVTDVSSRPWLPVAHTEWKSRDDLIDCILISSYIPGITSRKSPGDGRHIDGGLRNNFPMHPTAPRTVRVSPFSGELDICPELRPGYRSPRLVLMPSKVRLHMSRDNASAVLRTLFPPADDGWLQKTLARGFDDACRWLRSQ